MYCCFLLMSFLLVFSCSHYSITCVDTWKGDANLPKEYLDGAYERFLHNTSPWSEKVIVRVGESGVMLRSPELMKRQYSFIYIDGGVWFVINQFTELSH
jgi:hypothetical protein